MPRKSTGVYPPNWKEIATETKELSGWRCVRCNHKHDPESGLSELLGLGSGWLSNIACSGQVAGVGNADSLSQPSANCH